MNGMIDFAMGAINFFAVLFVFFLGCLLVALLAMYLVDVFQTTHTIRRNYPVMGRFRYFFEHLGGFFRQYFFAMDREELPFNRAERSWVYRAAKNIDRTVAFGSSKNLTPAGEIIFLNSPFPVAETEAHFHEDMVIGEGYVLNPYKPQSLFNISGMSYGALSAAAVKALAHGAKQAGVWMNTGEGGASMHHLHAGCDLVVQIGTAKYGVRDEQGKLDESKLVRLAKMDQVKMFEIKLSQGAKPGKGGLLPGIKVTAEIAEVRGIPEGKDSISPNAHEEIKNVGDMLDMIDRVRKCTNKPVGIKFVLGSYDWLDDLFAEIRRRGLQSAPDFMTLDSGDGGSGAAPQTLIDCVGLPLRTSLPILVDKLTEYGLRERIRVIASGKLITPAAVATALCLGADFIVSARGFMFAIGCIQALQCNKNTCPAGITTHDEKLQRGLHWQAKAERVAQYVANMQSELEMLAHSCGVHYPRQFTREHAHIVVEPRSSVPMSELHPYAKTKEEFVKVVET